MVCRGNKSVFRPTVHLSEADAEDDARDDAGERGEGEGAALHAALDLAPRYVRHVFADEVGISVLRSLFLVAPFLFFRGTALRCVTVLDLLIRVM